MKQKPKIDDMWPCACVKRDRKGVMKAIKMHTATTSKCRVCGCTKDQSDAIGNSNIAVSGGGGGADVH